jgi:hypothetical protein
MIQDLYPYSSTVEISSRFKVPASCTTCLEYYLYEIQDITYIVHDRKFKQSKDGGNPELARRPAETRRKINTTFGLDLTLHIG